MHLNQVFNQIGFGNWLMLIGVWVSVVVFAGCDGSPEQAVPAQSAASEKYEVPCDFSKEGVADLGYIEPESSHELTYVLHAPEDHAIVSIQIESDCPCVETIDIPESIPAGQSTPLVIRFKAPNKILHYQQDLTILTAQGRIQGGDKTGKIWLTIQARSGLPLRVEPEELQLIAGQANTSTVTIKNEGPDPIKLIYALSSNTAVKATVPKEPIQSGQAIEIQVTASEDWESNGPTTLKIKTTDDTQPEVTVWVRYKKPEALPSHEKM